ncbi:MAG: hypothetical protein AB7N76_09490 [Planctomycetota bacterium]
MQSSTEALDPQAAPEEERAALPPTTVAPPPLPDDQPGCVGSVVEEAEGIVLEAPAPARAAALAPLPGFAPELRSRVRQALSCPYCRDEVTRSVQSVECERDGCGALYHEECWDELRAAHGTCAVFGCGCARARPVSSAVYLWRVARLVIAALLVPRRVAEAVAEQEGEGLLTQVRRICELAYPTIDPGDVYGTTKLGVYLATSVGLAMLLARLLPTLLPPGFEALAPLLVPLLVLVLTVLIPTVLAAGGLALFVLARALVLTLRGELAALERPECAALIGKAAGQPARRGSKVKA